MNITIEIESNTSTITELEAMRPKDASTVVAIGNLKTNIAKLEQLRKQSPPPLVLQGKDKVRYDSAWKRYTSQTEKLEAFRMKTASLIIGQITPVLLLRLEQLPEWASTRSSQDPLKLFNLIEKSVLNQTKVAYPYKIVMDYMTDFCNYRQPTNLSDPEYSDTFNSTASIHQSVCMSLSHHPILLNYVSQELYKKDFDALIDADELDTVIADNHERFLAYNLIRLSNAPHSGLCDSLHNDYIQGSKRYPKKRSAALLLLLEQTTKTPSVSSISEGSSFAQKGGWSGEEIQTHQKSVGH
jgi:hypothetical protein